MGPRRHRTVGRAQC